MFAGMMHHWLWIWAGGAHSGAEPECPPVRVRPHSLYGLGGNGVVSGFVALLLA